MPRQSECQWDLRTICLNLARLQAAVRRQQTLHRVIVLIEDLCGAIGTPIPGWLKPPPPAQSFGGPPNQGRDHCGGRLQDPPCPREGNAEGSRSPQTLNLRSVDVSVWSTMDHRLDHVRCLDAAKISFGAALSCSCKTL